VPGAYHGSRPPVASAPAALPPLPYTGTLEKRSEMFGVWQPRRVVLDKGLLEYFKEGATSARASFGTSDLLGVDEQPPSTVLLYVRQAAGQERTYELRAKDEHDMRTWVMLTRKAFDFHGLPGSALASVAARSNSAPFSKRAVAGQAGMAVGSVLLFGAGTAASAIAKATGKEQWLDETLTAAKLSTARWREQIELQMEHALTSCDEGKINTLLDMALDRGVSADRVPEIVQKGARRVVGRNLREATASEDPKRLKGALVAARRLHATDVPEFEEAVAKYKAVRQMPEGWDVAKMLEQRRLGGAKFLSKPDVSRNSELRALVQLLMDRTVRTVYTRDRRGEPVPASYVVEQISEVQNEGMWWDYLARREAIKADVSERRGKFALANVDTEKPVAEAAATAATPDAKARAPSTGCKGGDLIEVDNPVTGEKLRVVMPSTAAPGGLLQLQELLLGAFPGPPLDTAANEAWLFHGTKPIAAESITSDDFRIDLAGTSAGSLYGRGIYLAENSSKADEYAHPDPKTGLHTMLICRVTLGQFLLTAEVDPDPRKCEEACLRGESHSIIGDRKACRGTFREFCVFDEDQVYPSYVVRYRRIMP